jgi:hypothetical protein
MRKYKLDEIVREYLIESVGASQIDQRYSRLLQIAISGLKNLNQDVRGITRLERIPVDSQNFIVTLPSDFISYKKVFVCIQGQQIALAVNENMCPPKFDDCGGPEMEGLSNTASQEGAGIFYPFGTNVPFDSYGSFTGRQYGIGGGNNSLGYFKIYPNEGYMAIQNMNASFDEVILEYLADVDSIDGTTYVHPFDVDAVKSYMYWKYIQRSAAYPMGEKQVAERSYNKDKMKARKRHNMFNATDLLSAYREGYRSSPQL